MNPISLSDLAFTLETVIDQAFGGKAVWVVAETSDIKNYPDRQYCFLTLVEREDGGGKRETTAKLEAVIWRKNYAIIRDFELATGQAFARNIQVLVLVSVAYNPVYGLRLEILRIDHSFTLGNLEKERQTVLDNLSMGYPDLVWVENGQYVTANQLLPRPPVLQRLALIAAPGSDGWRDFRHELLHNAYGYQFAVDDYLTQVQGQGAERAIVGQLARIQASEQVYDAVVIVRGGGSQLDFGSFDTEAMGLAVAAFPLPIFAGIGHERNVSITDLLCHQSVKTPTKAAAFLIDHNRQFEESCLRLQDRLVTASREALLTAREDVDRETDRFRFITQTFIRDRHTELAGLAVTVRHLDPINVLRRGYVLLWHDGHVVTRTSQLKPGDAVRAQLADGSISATVDGL